MYVPSLSPRGAPVAGVKGGSDVNSAFERRVHTAAVAGWWTLLIVVIVLWIQWGFYLWVMNARPDWVLAMVGKGVGWPFLQKLMVLAITAFKMCVWVMAVIVIWLTLWSRQMRRIGG